ncbi:hypothetical protein [Bifidobacterium stellenboschense]|nr:hypothetical protein [Bifidobacterium stellenboschense]
MESEWIDGGREAAQSVWGGEQSHGGMAGMAMFFVCLLAVAFIPGSGAGIWVARIGIVIIVPAIVAVVWNRIEQPETRTPLHGVSFTPRRKRYKPTPPIIENNMESLS